MFFSRIIVDANQQSARRLLIDRQALHAAVASVQQRGVSSDEGRVLWRLDHVNTRRPPVLYVVSPFDPQMDNLCAQLSPDRPPDVLDYSVILDKIDHGQEYRFRAQLNCTRSISQPGEGRSKKTGHTAPKYQREWLETRAPAAGMELVTDTIAVQSVPLTFGRDGKRCRISTAVFEGRLRVVDPQTLRRVLTNGLGSARGYGCGLFTLAP